MQLLQQEEEEEEGEGEGEEKEVVLSEEEQQVANVVALHCAAEDALLGEFLFFLEFPC